MSGKRFFGEALQIQEKSQQKRACVFDSICAWFPELAGKIKSTR
jgi:hypothetical protein